MKKIAKGFKILSIGLLISLICACNTSEEKLFNEGAKLQKDKKYEDAIKTYKEVINKDPKSKFATDSSKKLKECIDSIIKQGDEMSLKKDYFKSVVFYENALKFNSNDKKLKDKINKTKDMLTLNLKNKKEKELEEKEKSDNIKEELKEKDEVKDKGKENNENLKEEKKIDLKTKDNLKKEVKEKVENHPKENNSDLKKDKVHTESLTNVTGRKITKFTIDNKISNLVVDWSMAWETRDINVYKKFYDSNFVGVNGNKTMNYSEWMNYKSKIFSKYNRINTALKFIDAIEDKDRIKVRFKQWFTGYGDKRYSDCTRKELIFKHSNDKGWLIISERSY